MEEYINRFLEYIKYLKNFSPHSIRAYENDLKGFCKYLQTNDLQNAILLYLSRIQGSKVRTYARKISVIRSFLKFLEENDVNFKKIIFEYLKYPRGERVLPSFLTFDEVKKIISGIDITNFSGLRDRILFEFIFTSGIRVSEATNLKLADISLETRVCRIMGKGSKQRLCFFPKSLQNLLKKYLRERKIFLNMKNKDTDYVFINRFGDKITERSIHRRLVLWGRVAGIGKKIHPHILRHSFATYLMSAGVDIMFLKELLGHKSINTTQVYTHINFQDLKKYTDKILEGIT
ncbi:MAG: tyrosine-type recombinase/integrase [Planctomycetota bacterium]